jgi:polyisoprenoid-binding protein YceI
MLLEGEFKMLKMIWSSVFCLLVLGVTETVAQNFKVDTSRSEVRILAYKDGVLSGLAHSHVVVSNQVTGEVLLKDPLEKSGFRIKVPVGTLIVDDTTYRKEEGGDFATEMSAGDREEVRDKMLSDDLLDAEKYPHVEISAAQISGELPVLTLRLRVNLHGVSKDLEAPVQVKVQGKELRATGEVKLKQTDFDIEPISLFFGSVKVKDEVLVKFNITAVSF